jgi:hypothetical protein
VAARPHHVFEHFGGIPAYYNVALHCGFGIVG